MSVKNVLLIELRQKEKVILEIGNILTGDLQEWLFKYILIKVNPILILWMKTIIILMISMRTWID